MPKLPKPENEERAKRIYAARKAGTTFVEIGRNENICSQYVRTIFRRLERREEYNEFRASRGLPSIQEDIR